MFAWNIAAIPELLQSICRRHLAAYEAGLIRLNLSMIPHPEILILLPQAFAKSEWFALTVSHAPELLHELFLSGDIFRGPTQTYYQQQLGRLFELESLPEIYSKLRQIRRREMLKILWRDISAWADLTETVQALSYLADSVIDYTLNCLHQRAVKQSLNSVVPPLMVVALGKLGGGELNFSSDVDLMFAYPDNHELCDPEIFYTKIGQQLINALHQITEQGFVFRVDMRLRPFGESGALVMSHSAMQEYYQEHGRDWERYALMKARVITGNDLDREKLMTMMMSFVYRPYVDYAMLAAVREMKQKVEKEVLRKQLQENVKLGPGGIREIEFIVQSTQLIRAGRLRILQQQHLLTALKSLRDLHYLSVFVASELESAYIFLRQLEHKLQMFYDQQTHDLPSMPIIQARIAYAMDYPSWEDLSEKLLMVRKSVSKIFANLLLHDSNISEQSVSTVLESAHHHSRMADFLEKFQTSEISEVAKQRLNMLMPMIDQAICRLRDTEHATQIALRLLAVLVRRSTYLSLLIENAKSLPTLFDLLVQSHWLVDLLCQYPMLLEHLCNHQGLAKPLNKTLLQRDLLAQLEYISSADLERKMEALRQFKLIHLSRIAIADLQNQLPLMRVSDHLSELAETLLDAVEHWAWESCINRYGMPESADENEHGFLVIAYGKLGGIELSYHSDLDLVFLYEGDVGQTLADKSISYAEFYLKLVQRMIYLLQTKTYSGALYEIDLRLRPSGNAGLLVSNFSAFEEYQLTHAWTWEHQALLRARAVVGSSSLINQFNTLRQRVLCQKRDALVLRHEIKEMRDKIRQNHRHESPNSLKHAPGGLIDIEFLVQYLALCYASDHPELVEFTDNIRILEACARTSVLPKAKALELINIYKELRFLAHRQLLGVEINIEDSMKCRESVQTLWQEYLS